MNLDQLITASAPKKTSATKQGGSIPVGNAPTLDNLLSSKPNPLSANSRARIVPATPVKSPVASTLEDFMALPGRVANVFGTFGAGAAQGYKDAAATAQPKSFNLFDALDTGAKTLTETLTDSGKRLAEAYDPKNYASFSKGAATVGEAGLGLVNGIFSIVNVPLQAMTKIPVIGQVADKVNELFSAIGGGGSAVATKNILDQLPISDESKNTLRPLVSELGALTAQIIAGKAGHEVVPEAAKKTSELTNRLVTAIKETTSKPGSISSVDGLLKQSPRKLEVTSLPSDYNAGGVYEPYKSPSSLPTIEMGPRAEPNGLPSIDFGPTAGRVSRVQPIAGDTAPILTQPPRAGARAREIKPIGTGDTKLSTLSSKVNARAVEEGLTNALSDLPEYKTMNIAEQARLATDLVSKDPRMALQIAKGERLPPPNLHPESVFKAVEDAAIRAGDIETIQELASGNLSRQATAMGQRIRLLGERDPNSPVTIIRQISEAREKNIETKTGVKYEKAKAEVVSQIKSEIKKAAPSKETWGDFIKSLECGY